MGVSLRRPSPGAVTSPFGRRISGFHEGIDFGWGNGWNIYAAASGTVRHAGPGGIYGARYGNLTRIDHGGGTETRYAHQSRMYVRVGQKVTAGQLIGVKGGSGAKGLNTYDPHLHFELLINGRKVNPDPYFTSTASGNITPLIEPELEYDMTKIYKTDGPDKDGRRHALAGEFSFQTLTLSAAQEEWNIREGEVFGADQATWDRIEARTIARRKEAGIGGVVAAPIDYAKLAAEVAKLLPAATGAPTAAENAAEVIRQMKLPGN